MRCAALTVDVDRDVNEPRPGQIEGCSRGCPTARFTSTLEGLRLLVDLLDELDISATFFLEGEIAERWSGDLEGLLEGHEVASHSYAHEDLTGESTGIEPSPDWVDAVVGRSLAIIEDSFGRRPVGFRAPYQHIDERLASVLSRRGMRYDSSLFADVPSNKAYLLPSGLLEVPLTQGTAPDGGRMQSYLWPLHEGRRRPADYLHLFSQQKEGIMVLADHSWHVVESRGGRRSEQGVKIELDAVRSVVEGILDSGAEFMTLESYIARVSDGE